MINMNSCFKTYFLLLLLASLTCVLPDTAYAYIDPGSGSSLLQLILCAIIGGFFTFKLLFLKYKNKLKKLFSKADKKNSDAEN